MDNDANVSEIGTFQAREYKPSGGFTVSGIVSMGAAMVVVGGVLGYIAHLVQQYYWLIVLFPIGIGVAMGAVGNWCVARGRIRNHIVAGATGFIGGVFAMTTMHYFDYERFQSLLAQNTEFVTEVRAMSPEEKHQLVVDAAGEADDMRSFIAMAEVDSFHSYLNWEAAQGIRIGSSTSSSGGAPITGIGVWIYWVIEMVIVAAVAYMMMRKRASEPFSELAADWKVSKWLGSFTLDNLPAVTRILRAGNLPELVALSPSAGAGPVMVSAYVAKGHEDADDIDVKVDAHVDGKTKPIASFTYPPEAMASLERVFNAPEVASDNASSANPA